MDSGKWFFIVFGLVKYISMGIESFIYFYFFM